MNIKNYPSSEKNKNYLRDNSTKVFKRSNLKNKL